MKNKFLNSITFPKTYVVEPEYHSDTRKNVKTKIIKYEATGRELDSLEKLKAEKLKKEGKELPFYRRAVLTKEEKIITREIEYVNLYPKNLKINFKPGLNLIVGENGSGKTTLLRIICDYVKIGFQSEDDKRLAKLGSIINGKETKKENEKPTGIYKDSWGREVHFDVENLTFNNFFGWDFESDNPLTNERYKPVDGESSKVVVSKLAFLWGVKEESHGETNRACLSSFTEVKNSLIVFDEPESAISLKGQYEYWNVLKKISETNQVIMITHSKVFMDEAGEVFDMESKKWMKSESYFKRIKRTVKSK